LNEKAYLFVKKKRKIYSLLQNNIGVVGFLGNIPRDKWVDGRAPFVLVHVKVRVAHPAIKNSERNVFLSGCSVDTPFLTQTKNSK
jgi:hypothetical protein